MGSNPISSARFTRKAGVARKNDMDQLDEIRSKIDIVQLISEYLPLKKAGRNFKALCPFHSEKVPSFIVSPERQIFKCFGCSVSGDVFTFLMKTEGMEFGEALQTLAKRAGVKLISYRPTGREAEKEKLYAVNHLTSEFYHYLLVNHAVGKKALNYVLGRGITKDLIRNFKLGFAPSLWNGLQKFLIGKKGYKLEDLQNAGLISRVSGQARDFFRERIIFPLKDHRGNVVGFSGRVMPGKDESVPKYINITETLAYQKGRLLYGLEKAKEKVKKEGEVIIVEGEFDVISSFQAGVENVVAIKGSALSQDQCRLLKRFGEEIILALDRDVAGDAAARRGIEIADSFGFDIKVVRLPEGKDPDQLAQKSPQAWKKAIDQAVPVYDFFIDSACFRFDRGSPSGKRRIGDEVLPVLKKITNDLVRAHYIKVLAEKLTLPEEALLAQMEKTSLPAEERPAPQVKKEEKLSRRQLLEEYLLALAFQGKRPRPLLKRKISALIQTPASARIIKLLRQYFKRRKKFSSESFVKNLPSELVEIFNFLFLKDLGEKVEDEDWLEKEVSRTIFELEKLDLGQKLKAISLEIAALEKEKKPRKMKAKQEEFKKLSQQLSKLRPISARG